MNIFFVNFIFLIFVHHFIVSNGTKNVSLDLAKFGPLKVKFELHGECSSLLLCYDSAFYGKKNFPWKLSKRFKFNKMFNASTTAGVDECGTNGKMKIQISFTNRTIIVENENFMFKYIDKVNLSAVPIVEFNFMISDNFLTINNVSPNPKGFYKEFFEESKLGSFLEEYVGLWLLAADIMPNLRQKLTKLIFMVPDKCRLIRDERHPQNCATFDQMAFEKKHRSVRQINPLISGGAKIDIKHMPWVVYFMGVIQTNLFETKIVACTASLISPKFVLLAAHCFDEVAENKLILLGFGSNSRNLTSKQYDGFLVELLRHTDLNVIIHPMYKRKAGINDLALIKMDKEVELSSTIFPICIHCGAREKFEEGKAYIAGWGYLKNSCTQKSQKSPLTLMGRSAQLVKCKKSFFNDGQERICIEKNTIEQGDSGGPLLATNGTNFVQIGVASGGLCNSLFGTSILNIYSPLDGCWIEKIADVQCGI